MGDFIFIQKQLSGHLRCPKLIPFVENVTLKHLWNWAGLTSVSQLKGYHFATP